MMRHNVSYRSLLPAGPSSSAVTVNVTSCVDVSYAAAEIIGFFGFENVYVPLVDRSLPPEPWMTLQVKELR